MFSKHFLNVPHKLIAIVLLLAFGMAVHAGQASWRQAFPELKATGSGRMTYFGLKIYDATLWTRGQGWTASEPFALELVYARSISREQLVESSVEEMQRVGIPRERAEAWAPDMRRVFLDVKPGDRLIGLFIPDVGARFYSAQGLIDEVRDPAFARAFAAIWLDPRTREPELRRKLLASAS